MTGITAAVLARHRLDSRRCVERKLRLARVDLDRRDLRGQLIVERLEEWLDSLRSDRVEPPPPASDSLGARISRRLELDRLSTRGDL